MAPVSSKNIISNPAKSKLHKVQQPKTGLPYTLYLHCQELRKKKTEIISKAYTKLQLTEKLITHNIRNVHKCSADDLQILSRETIFKKNLKRHIGRMKFMLMMKHKQQKKQQAEQYSSQQNLQEQPQPTGSNSNENVPMDIEPTTQGGGGLLRRVFSAIF